MLSEGNFHKDIAKVLSRSTVSINQRVLKLRGKGQSRLTARPFRSNFHTFGFTGVLPQSSRRGGLQSNVVEDALRGAPPVVVAPSLGQIIDATPSRSSLPLASFTPPVSIDQVPFSPEDERLILQLHSTLPGQFKKISRQMQPIRHKKEVRERYEELQVDTLILTRHRTPELTIFSLRQHREQGTFEFTRFIFRRQSFFSPRSSLKRFHSQQISSSCPHIWTSSTPELDSQTTGGRSRLESSPSD